MPHSSEVVTKHVIYTKVVEDITEAWSFVMSHIDLVGDDPMIHIAPRWCQCEPSEDHKGVREFEVVIQGDVT